MNPGAVIGFVGGASAGYVSDGATGALVGGILGAATGAVAGPAVAAEAGAAVAEYVGGSEVVGAGVTTAMIGGTSGGVAAGATDLVKSGQINFGDILTRMAVGGLSPVLSGEALVIGFPAESAVGETGLYVMSTGLNRSGATGGWKAECLNSAFQAKPLLDFAKNGTFAIQILDQGPIVS